MHPAPQSATLAAGARAHNEAPLSTLTAANAPNPASGLQQFEEGDPRLAFAEESVDGMHARLLARSCEDLCGHACRLGAALLLHTFFAS